MPDDWGTEPALYETEHAYDAAVAYIVGGDHQLAHGEPLTVQMLTWDEDETRDYDETELQESECARHTITITGCGLCP